MSEDWKRQCPKCGKALSYKRKYTFIRAIELNSLCRSCGVSRGKRKKYITAYSIRLNILANEIFSKD